jgi:hypothetical protein
VGITERKEKNRKYEMEAKTRAVTDDQTVAKRGNREGRMHH